MMDVYQNMGTFIMKPFTLNQGTGKVNFDGKIYILD